MHRVRWRLVAVLVLTATLLPVCPVAASQPARERGADSILSPYWSPAVRRWESIIIEYAHRRGLAPDLVAAVIWKESLGRPYVHSPAGAVGLMQVMPKEEGFPWRPTAQELEEPGRNVDWGTLALSKAIRESHGDVYSALAAYNGGWHQIHLRGPRQYAAATLLHYGQAVAMRCGLSPEGHWVATVAAIDQGARRVLTVTGPHRDLARYTNRPVAAYLPDATVDGPPTVVAFSPTDGQDLDSRVGIWILIDGQVVQEPDPRETTSSEPSTVFTGARRAWESPESLTRRER